MVDLNGVSGQQALENRETALKKSSTVKANDESSSGEASRLHQPDSIELNSEVAKALASAEDFDSEKVEKIKEAIAKGEYPIDSRQIAKSMADLEEIALGRNCSVNPVEEVLSEAESKVTNLKALLNQEFDYIKNDNLDQLTSSRGKK